MRPNTTTFYDGVNLFPVEWAAGSHGITITPNSASVSVYYTRELPPKTINGRYDFSVVTTWVPVDGLQNVTTTTAVTAGTATCFRIEVFGNSAQFDIITSKYAYVTTGQNLTLDNVPDGSIIFNNGDQLFGDGSFTYDYDTSTLSVPNLVTTGTVTSVETTNYDVTDALIGLALNNATDLLDIGWIGERASNNIASFWDESADEFAFALVTDDSTVNTVSITDYANLHVGGLIAEDTVTMNRGVINGGSTGLNQALLQLNSASGFLNVECSDLSAANPTWALNTAPGENFKLRTGSIDRFELNSSTGLASFLYDLQVDGFILNDQGNLKFDVTGGTNYHAFYVDGVEKLNITDSLLVMDGNFSVTGQAQIDGALTVTGLGTLNGGLNVTGNAYVSGNTLVGTTSDNGNRLQVSGNAYVSGLLGVGTANPDGDINLVSSIGGEFVFSRNDTSVVDGENLGVLTFQGNDTTGNSYRDLAYIICEADGTHSAGNNPTRFTISVTPLSSETPAERLRLDSTTTVNDTALLLWDVTAGTMKRVSRGAPDSAGTGFRTLRIPN